MRKTILGRIRFVDSYVDAPKNARYILRRMYDQSWRFEKYFNNNSNSSTLKTFEITLEETDIFERIAECRSMILSSETIWVEKEGWMYEPNAKSEYKRAYNKFYNKYNRK